MTKPISWTSFKWREILFCLVSALQRWQRAIFGRPADSAGTELHIAFIAFDMVSSKKYEFIHQSEGQAQGTVWQPPNEVFHHFKVGLWSPLSFSVGFSNAMKGVKVRHQMAPRFVSTLAFSAMFKCALYMTFIVMPVGTGLIQVLTPALSTNILAIIGVKYILPCNFQEYPISQLI